ncbi:MAG TPA: alpha-amylase family glycosyl hydrolase, partial [Gaiellaceae bacterium]|nr:alpha-amylase family glycosyl hydrolase [Gaiellaceae bacterium]
MRRSADSRSQARIRSRGSAPRRPLKAAAYAAAITPVAVVAGVVTLALAAGVAARPDAVAPPRGAALTELAKQPVRTTIASERIYFVMTDRYANGNTSNDALPGFDPTNTGYFHGGDFSGLNANLERLRDLGFTAVWVTPPFVNKAVQADSAGYHGYWGLDFTRVDPHLGGDAEFAAFVGRAHGLGLKVYLDVVVNHTADVIQLSSDAFVAPPAPPHGAIVPASERDVKRPSWLNDPANYHNR